MCVCVCVCTCMCVGFLINCILNFVSYSVFKNHKMIDRDNTGITVHVRVPVDLVF